MSTIPKALSFVGQGIQKARNFKWHRIISEFSCFWFVLVCHGNTWKSLKKACKINGVLAQSGAHYTMLHHFGKNLAMAIPIIKQVLKKDGKAAASFYEKACRFLARDKYSKTIVWKNWHKCIGRDSVYLRLWEKYLCGRQCFRKYELHIRRLQQNNDWQSCADCFICAALYSNTSCWTVGKAYTKPEYGNRTVFPVPTHCRSKWEVAVGYGQRLFRFMPIVLQTGIVYGFDISKICWYANSIALQVKFSHIWGGLFSEKPVGRNSKHLSEWNVWSKADAKL